MSTVATFPGQTGAQTSYTIPFLYLHKDDVQCLLDGTPINTNYYTIDGTTLTFTVAPTGDLMIRRVTGVAAKYAAYASGSPIKSRDLNTQNDQFLYSLQEIKEQYITGFPVFDFTVGEAVALLQTDLTTEIADRITAIQAESAALAAEVADRIAAAQALSDALAIEVTDRQNAITAEAATRTAAVDAVITSATTNANDIAQEASDRATAISDEAAARVAAIQVEIDARIAAVAANATTIDSLTTTVGTNTGDITTINSVIAGFDYASAASVTALTSTVGTNTAGIVTLNDTIAAFDYASATVVTALTVEVDANTADIITINSTIAGFDYASASSVTALNVEVDANTASVITINDTIAGFDYASAASVTALTSVVGTNTADIVTVNSTIAGFTYAETSTLNALTSRVDTAEGDITTLQTTQASLTNALSRRIDRLTAEFTGNMASALNEITARSSETDAAVQRLSVIEASIGEGNDIAARVATLETVTVDLENDKAEASVLTALDTRVGTAESAITTESSARSTGDSTLTTSLGVQTSRIDDAEANIVSLQDTVVTDRNVSLRSIDSMRAQLAGVSAGFLQEINVRADDVEVQVNRLDALVVQVGDAEALIATEETVRADADSALTTSLSTQISRIDDAEADIIAEGVTRADADGAFTSSLNVQIARIDDAEADIIAEGVTRADADSAATTALNAQISRIDTAEADIISEASTRASADTANTNSIATERGRIDTNVSEITTIKTTETTNTAAQARRTDALIAETISGLAASLSEFEVRSNEAEQSASRVDSLYVSSASQAAAISTIQTVTIPGVSATASDALTRASAIYGVRLDVNDYISGFGLSNDGTEAVFAILADKFQIARPGNGAPVVSFTVDGSGNINLSDDIYAQSFHATKAGSSKTIILKEMSDSILWYGDTADEGSPTKANADVALGSDGLLYVSGEPLGALAVRSVLTSGAPSLIDTDRTATAGAATVEMCSITTASLESGAAVDVAVDFAPSTLWTATPALILDSISFGGPTDTHIRLYRDYGGAEEAMLEEIEVRLNFAGETVATLVNAHQLKMRQTDTAPSDGVQVYSCRLETENTSTGSPQGIEKKWTNLRRIMSYVERRA